MRWPRRSCSSCRRISKACRWWRSRRGRSGSRCSPTAAATCSRGNASAAMPACTTTTFREFIETLRAIDFNPSLAAALGRNGREYFNRHYAWPIIERKYLDMLDRLSRASISQQRRMDPLPGWFARRRSALPPADEVVSKLPTGPLCEHLACSRLQTPRRQVPVPRPHRPGPRASGPRPPSASGRPVALERANRNRVRVSSRRHDRPRSGLRHRANAGIAGRVHADHMVIAAGRADVRGAIRATGEHACRSSGSRHARLRRRDRQRSAGHPARAPAGRLCSRRFLSRPPTDDSRHLTVDYRELPDASHPDNILIHHFSIGSRASRIAYALPDRMVLVYHNITPPEYFVDVHPLLVQQCFLGRRELGFYASRCDSGAWRLGIQPARARRRGLSAHRRASGGSGLFASRGTAEYGHAGAFDDDWVNLLFVGRMIPNKRIEDVIRWFHAYKRWFNPRSRLLLVGSHSGFERYVAMLHHFIAEIGAADVYFLGHVSNEELVRLLRARGRLPLRQRARGLLRSADGGVSHGRAGDRIRGRSGTGNDGRRRRAGDRQGSGRRSPG